MTNQELMQKLEQLFRLYIPAHSKFQPTIAALREALAEQPAQQEPVAKDSLLIKFHRYLQRLPDPKHHSTSYGGQWSSDWCVCLTETGSAEAHRFIVGNTEKEALTEGRRVYSNWHKPGWSPKYVAWAYADEVIAALNGAPAPLYTRPQAREPLTDAQIESTFIKCGGRWSGDHWVIEDADLHPFVRTIESPELSVLRAISDEYNAWIKHHAAGHTYDDFLAKRTAHGIKKDDGFAAKAA